MKRLISFFVLIYFVIYMFGCAPATINWASMEDGLNTVEQIVARDKQAVNQKNDDGETPLHLAAYMGKLEIVIYLVSQGADLNATDNYLQTPLHEAAYQARTEIADFLISNGSRVNAKDISAETPLHIAANREDLEFVRYLVSQGANVNIKDVNGETPVFNAVPSSNNNSFNTVKYLISSGADLKIKNKDGRTLLHKAIERSIYRSTNEHIVFLQYLLSQGSEINAKDNDGKTALHLATDYDRLKIVKFLVDKGADIYLADNNGDSPIDYARRKDLISIQNLFVSFKERDSSPPKIIISSHNTDRGIKVTSNSDYIKITGRVTDDSSLETIFVNGKQTRFDNLGNFSTNVHLDPGDKSVVVSALDKHQNEASIKININREPVMVSVTLEDPASHTNQFALIIGNNNYRYLRKLNTAVNDAKVISEILVNEYGFKTKLLLDANRDSLLDALNGYRKNLTDNDNLLIYYAGHGEFDQIANKAYWLPIDAESDNDTNWIIADRITSNIKRIPAKHILVVADSCYSGTLTRSAITDLKSNEQRDRYLKKMTGKKSRSLMASGGNEPVSDAGSKGHSIFAEALLVGLKNMELLEFTAEELFYEHIKEKVAGNADQIPEYNIIRNSGHDGGDFIFTRR